MQNVVLTVIISCLFLCSCGNDLPEIQKLESEYELVNYKPGEKDKIKKEEKINLYLTTQVCPSIKKEFLGIGVSVRYIYKGNDGQLIVNRVFKPGDC